MDNMEWWSKFDVLHSQFIVRYFLYFSVIFTLPCLNFH